jgi:hypothetical protein
MRESKMLKMKTLLKEYSILKPTQVKPGMIGTDYNDEKVKIIKIVPAKDWKQLKKYDTSGWMYDSTEMSSEYDIDFKTDYLVAVELIEHGHETEVFTYGDGGVDVPTKKIKEAARVPLTLKASGWGENVAYAQHNIESEFYELSNKIDEYENFVAKEIKDLPKQYQSITQAEVNKVWNKFHRAVSDLMPALLDALEVGLKKK